ncbi:hypothetical protein RHGRI_025238 [Rhododendron griersonianum]|uniref:Uncharacterized protein n=1 Tax=Rhododendron griersonianum TaxID=479676 RepID=A0AAV6JEU3_9ERIC|nr:hypothetical protein RHGRI_025238 [Rhododendron griersonianum]
MEKIFACGLLCLLLLYVAFGGEQECDREFKCVWGPACSEDAMTCFDDCWTVVEDSDRNARLLFATYIPGTNMCRCHMISKTLCDAESPALAPAPAPSTGGEVMD